VSQSDISEVTQLHSGSISRCLTGKRGNYDQYFEESNGLYRLNSDGFSWIVSEIYRELKHTIEIE
jgi:hypothetical protein